MVTAPVRHVFTVDEWDRLGRLGFFGEDDRVELVDGEIVDMTPIGAPHAECVRRLNRLFMTQAGDVAVVAVQDPIRLSGHSEPQPDLALLRPKRYAEVHPGPEDVLLVIEVADRSLQYDRDRKAPLYGRAGIQECWVVDLTSDTVIVLTDPGQREYGSSAVRRAGDVLVPILFPEARVSVSTILGLD